MKIILKTVSRSFVKQIVKTTSRVSLYIKLLLFSPFHAVLQWLLLYTDLRGRWITLSAGPLVTTVERDYIVSRLIDVKIARAICPQILSSKGVSPEITLVNHN